MLAIEIMSQLIELQKLWADGIIPDSSLEESVLNNLVDADVKQYELADVLRTDVINLLLKNGGQQLRYEGRGGVRMIDSGHIVDLSHLAPMYRKLFKQWETRSWIRIEGEQVIIHAGR